MGTDVITGVVTDQQNKCRGKANDWPLWDGIKTRRSKTLRHAPEAAAAYLIDIASMDPFQNGIRGTDLTPSRDTEIVKEWINLAAEIVAVPSAAVYGFLLGGPAGAGVGAAVGTLASHGLLALGLEIWERQMPGGE